MTKKDFLELIEDAPDSAKIVVRDINSDSNEEVTRIVIRYGDYEANGKLKSDNLVILQ